jgi:hypothetical protein
MLMLPDISCSFLQIANHLENIICWFKLLLFYIFLFTPTTKNYAITPGIFEIFLGVNFNIFFTTK